MKKIYSFMVAAVAMIAAVSCNKEFTNDNLFGGKVITFRASLDGADTKAHLVEGKSQWEANDAITILNGTSDFKFTTAGEGASVNFTYDNKNNDFTGEQFAAVYPASAGFPYSADFGSMTINAHIPTWQEAVVDSYPKNAALSVAYTKTDELYFMNAVALLKFTVGEQNIKSVTFCGGNSDAISGNVQVNLDETGKSVISVAGQPTSIFGFATEDNKVYLCPNADWNTDGARFAAYFFVDDKVNTWRDMTKSPLKEDVYEVTIPTDKVYPKVIFCRMNPSTTANNWDNKWNQSQDLTLNQGILYTVKGWDKTGIWEKETKDYETFVELYANGNALAVNKTYYMAIAPKVYEKGFSIQLEKNDKKETIATRTTSFEIKPSTIIDLGNLIYPKDRSLKFASTSVSVLLNQEFEEPELTGEKEGVTFKSSDTSVATVDETTGDVTILAVGTTTITASAPATMGYTAGEANYELTVTQKKDRGLKFSSEKVSIVNGNGTTPTLSGATEAAKVGVTYSSENTSVATVDASGNVTVKGAGVVTITASAPETEEFLAGTATYTLYANMLYLIPNSNWKVDNARFAAYFFGDGETWVSMTDQDKDGIYEVEVPTSKTYPNVIFCRMNPSASANNWNNKWNQTSDLKAPTDGNNLYTVKEGTWDNGGGTWSVK